MKRYSIEEVVEINAKYKNSKLSIEKFAQSIGIKKHTMAWIRTRAIRDVALRNDNKERLSFTEVNAFNPQPIQAKEMRLEFNDVSIFLNDNFDSDTLTRVMRVLQND